MAAAAADVKQDDSLCAAFTEAIKEYIPPEGIEFSSKERDNRSHDGCYIMVLICTYLKRISLRYIAWARYGKVKVALAECEYSEPLGVKIEAIEMIINERFYNTVEDALFCMANRYARVLYPNTGSKIKSAGKN